MALILRILGIMRMLFLLPVSFFLSKAEMLPARFLSGEPMDEDCQGGCIVEVASVRANPFGPLTDKDCRAYYPVASRECWPCIEGRCRVEEGKEYDRPYAVWARGCRVRFTVVRGCD